MKNSILILSATAIGLLSTSCKKNYTCKCEFTETYSYQYTDYDGKVTPYVESESGQTSTVINDKKNKAKTKCEAYNLSSSSGSLTEGQYKMEQTCNIQE